MSGEAAAAAPGRPRSLAQLAAGIFAAPEDVRVSDLTLDSRAVTPGALFLACRGLTHHGLEFAEQALGRGARAVVYEEPGEDQVAQAARAALQQAAAQAEPGAVFVARVPWLSRHLGVIADRFFSEPSRHLRVIGVTGTNGKTTCAYLAAQALSLCGRPAGYIGTLGYGSPQALKPAAHTTADVVSVHRQLAQLRTLGMQCIGMEVSSHALHQGRVDEVRFEAAAFTNLTQDHLDYHGTMEAYGAAKARLFERDTLTTRIVNVDDEFGRALSRMPAPPAHGRLITISRHARPDEAVSGGEHISAAQISRHAGGLAVAVHSSWGTAEVRAPLIGDFNVENLLIVLGMLLSAGVPLTQAAAALSRCAPPAGRMEVIAAAGAPTAIIDYAHTPDALAKALSAARAHCAGRLWLVFGCGGDRDVLKRPQMGRIAVALADEVTVTDDNPRGEEPGQIVRDILADIAATAAVRIEHDREGAIRGAIARARAGDVVLIAGKGHEEYQICGQQRRPFSDRDVARAALGAGATPGDNATPGANATLGAGA